MVSQGLSQLDEQDKITKESEEETVCEPGTTAGADMGE